MSPYSFSAAVAISGSGFQSRKLEYPTGPRQSYTHANIEEYTRFRPRNWRKSLSEQQPHCRPDSMPMISCKRMACGVPRALNAPAGFAVLSRNQQHERRRGLARGRTGPGEGVPNRCPCRFHQAGVGVCVNACQDAATE